MHDFSVPISIEENKKQKHFNKLEQHDGTL